MPFLLFLVRPAAHVSNRRKFRNPPGSGKDIAEGKCDHREVEPEGSREHTNQWAKLWSDEQKSHQALHEGKTARQVKAQ